MHCPQKSKIILRWVFERVYKQGYENMESEKLEGISEVFPKERIIRLRTGREAVILEGSRDEDSSQQKW